MPARTKKREIDILQPADYELFRLGAKNVNYISDYYLRSPTSGTRWEEFPTPENERISAGWRVLYNAWAIDQKPIPNWTFNDIEYEVFEDPEHGIIFFHHHGWLFQGWQSRVHHCSQEEVTLIAGFGVGKTALEAASACVLAMTIPYARIFCIAPQMMQAKEVYNYITLNFKDTPFWNRFVWKNPLTPYPQIEIRSDYIGESRIEFYSIEHNSEKVRTLEGDVVMLDQAEKIQDLDELRRDSGSRLRGMTHGRAKLGKYIMFANAGDNDELYYRYDMQNEEPETYLSLTVKSWENPYLSDRDIARLKRSVGGTNDQIDQWLGGERPLGSGEHFPAHIVKLCHEQGLDNIMDDAIERVAKYRDEEQRLARLGQTPSISIEKIPGFNFIKRIAPRAGVYHWELPPDHDAQRKYIVIGDPGQGNPPDRNSPPIMVWDVTDFPDKPAILRAFSWVFGNGSYWPFVTEYQRLVEAYRAYGRNGFDSTGTQKGFDELVFSMQNLAAEGLNLSGNNKYLALNSLKMFLGKRLMIFPHIGHLNNQLTSYKLPDTKIKQDLVMCMAMSAMFMRRYYWLDMDDQENKKKGKIPEKSRYARPIGNRYSRGVSR